MTLHGSPPDGGGSPFLLGLKRYDERQIIRFHTPGHRGGRWLDPHFRDVLGESAASIDVSDVLEGDVGPADWSETIRTSEGRAAELFGASATRFLVNGTSGGIHAALMAVGMGKRAAFSRTSHLSVYAAAILCGLDSFYIEPDYDATWDIPGPPTQSAIRGALHSARPDVVIDTYPNYYGLAPDLRMWRSLAKPGQIPLLITDEAHGSHFRVCPSSPPPGLSIGAALTVQSFHKTLGALTQASALHVSRHASDLVARVDRSLFLLQTTSPSPILLASLEAAVSQIEQSDEGWKRAVRIAALLRSAIDQRTDCHCLSEAYAQTRWGAKLDPVRLVVNVSGAGWSGIDAATWLRTQRRIQVEMANQTSIVVLISPGNTEREAERLVDGLGGLSKIDAPHQPGVVSPPPRPNSQIDPREAVSRPTEWVPLEDAIGRVSAELLCPYPPGMPILAPGEGITAEIVEYLGHVKRVGWEVRGASMWGSDRIGVVQ